MLVIYGPCKTWIAWFVTEPELFAIGDAVALTPPTVSAFTGTVTITLRADRHNAFIAGKYL